MSGCQALRVRVRAAAVLVAAHALPYLAWSASRPLLSDRGQAGFDALLARCGALALVLAALALLPLCWTACAAAWRVAGQPGPLGPSRRQGLPTTELLPRTRAARTLAVVLVLGTSGVPAAPAAAAAGTAVTSGAATSHQDRPVPAVSVLAGLPLPDLPLGAALPPAPPRPPTRPATATVRAGDDLWTLATAWLGSGRGDRRGGQKGTPPARAVARLVHRTARANPGVLDDPDLLRPGDRLAVPPPRRPPHEQQHEQQSTHHRLRGEHR